jgi:DNA-binding protein YbaB
MTEIVGTARKGGVTVEVYPGGTLSSITLSEHAIASGTGELAASVLGAVAEATALANQRTRHALGDALTVLGYGSDAELVELVEATTPDSWRL